MSRAKLLLVATLLVALSPLLRAQQSASTLAEPVITASPTPEANVTPGNLFERPGQVPTKSALDDDGALLLQVDRKHTSWLGQYAFTAPPGFYSADRSAAEPSDWASDVSGALTAYFNSSYTSGLRFSGDLLAYGEKLQPGAAGYPGGQTFTAEGEFVRVVNSRFGALEIGGGSYWQKIVANRAFSNSPVTDVLERYSGSEIGIETTLTIPDRNLAFQFRLGNGSVGIRNFRSHVASFQLSWSW